MLPAESIVLANDIGRGIIALWSKACRWGIDRDLGSMVIVRGLVVYNLPYKKIIVK